MPKNVGYDDTPDLPGGKWKVHDGHRPQPRVVTPGTNSTSVAPGEIPSDAIVLFDGTDLSHWIGRDGEAAWKVEDGYMEVVAGAGNILSKEHFGDCQLHIEWAEPAVVEGESQGRGNSGVFLMDKYEIQVLDGYDNPTYADGQCGAIYGQYPPMVNASRKPGEWQEYDIIFEAPRWNAARVLEKPAFITVLQNGVVLHHRQEIMGPTVNRQGTNYNTPHDAEGPLHLQDHSNPVRYRNIWMRRLLGYDL